MKAADLSTQEIWDWVCQWYGRPCHAALEQVRGYIGNDYGKEEEASHARGSHMFTFGASYGRLQMALTAATLPHEEVTPQAWQKVLRLKTPVHPVPLPHRMKRPYNQWKSVLQEYAQSLFPDVRVTKPIADALLLAYYASLVSREEVSSHA